MINGRRVIQAVICGLIVAEAANAEMMSVYKPDTERVQNCSVYNQFNNYRPNSSGSNNFIHFANLDSLSIGFLLPEIADVEQTTEKQHLQSFTNGPGSLNLCLSALIGLGLCSSAHLVRKISFGFIPEWYHNGGPFQIGHSYAVTPETLYPLPVYCFAQPVCEVDDSLTQYRLGIVTSLWRKSQFTPDVIASRGPPSSSLLR